MQIKKVSPVPRDNFDIDDYIGMESCVDLRENDHPAPPPSCKRDRKMWGLGSRVEREYPPPIPLLVRSANRGDSHMPWVLKRRYTGDGRLILTEERVKHHEFFLAHRSDSRLILQLVVADESNEDEFAAVEEDGESNEDECAAAEEEEVGEGVGISVGGGMCYKYGSVGGRDPAFMFGVAVPAGNLRTTVRS